ncbi:OsmC family protein [Luteithermobacter gelatinilyticus]|uniref:OsmC family protein n=1 Tax=Luteithermobacter gelatinilyticus TaxID=2582913 RepID=UPI0011057E84|nr:OsmC family protein [Luteithermobacter gelatinilyticus]
MGMKKDVTVSWAGKMTFIGEAASGNTVTMDAGKDNGGLGLGHSPMDLLLMGAGGCACIDVVMILKKARQTLVDCVCQVSGVRAEEMPQVYTDIHMHFIVTGTDLREEAVKRAVELSMTKYCSASATLAKGAKLTYDWDIKQA